jgi:hypothetical protein
VTGDCPSAAAVRERLGKLVGPAGPGRVPDVAHVEVVGATLAIDLRRETGEIIGDKRLPLGAGCAERAESAAIVLAAWEAQLGDHAAATLSPPVTPPPAREVVTASSPPPQPPPPPATAPTVVSNPARSAPPTAAPGGWALSPGGSLLASIDSDDTALAATAEEVVSWRGSPFAVAGSAMFVSSHVTSVAPGTGSWRRFGLVVDARRRARWPRFWLQARSGVALTILSISGSGLSANGGGTAVDPGVVGALRLGLSETPATAWLEVGANVWPRRQTLAVRGGAATDLPVLDVLVGIGFSIERPP